MKDEDQAPEIDWDAMKNEVMVLSHVFADRIEMEGRTTVNGTVTRSFYETMNLKDNAVREGLIHLGWKPPDPEEENRLLMALHTDPFIQEVAYRVFGYPGENMSASEVCRRQSQMKELVRFLEELVNLVGIPPLPSFTNNMIEWGTCPECGGSKLVPMGEGVRGVKKCPTCKGKGVVPKRNTKYGPSPAGEFVTQHLCDPVREEES